MMIFPFRFIAGWVALITMATVGLAQAVLPAATVGVAYTFQVTTTPVAASGTVYSATGLPAGLAINATSGIISGAPTAAGVAVGSISLTAGGLTNTFSFSLTVSSGSIPLVVITSPVSGATFATGTMPALSVSIAAEAIDVDGTITQVQFFANGVAIGTDVTNPYGVEFTPTAWGDFSLIAVATDNVGNINGSSPVQLSIVPAQTPAVSITSPNAGEALLINSPRLVAAAVAPAPGRSIVSVMFYANGIPIAAPVSVAPYQVIWTPASPGSYALTAVATDDVTMAGTSPVVPVTVLPGLSPTVMITSPANGATLPAHVPHTLIATATVSAPATSVVAVNFRADGVLIGIDTHAPYTVTWTPTTGGTSALTAEVIDGYGMSTISVPVYVNIVVPPAVVTLSAPREVVGFQQSLTLSTTVTGFPVPTLQWKRNGAPLAGGATAHYTITGADPSAHAGWYELFATSDSGTAKSAVIFVNVAVPADPLVGWGNPASGLNTIPAGLAEVAGMATGGFLSIAVKRDGTVATWGTPASGSTPIPPGLNGVVAVAAGEWHGLALRSDGTVVAWGLDNQGQISVPAGLNEVVAIAAGGYHSLALKRDGTVVGWGLNGRGQTSVPAGLTGVNAIAAGYQHSFALKTNGTVAAWGSDEFGETTFANGRTGMAAVAGGFYNSLILDLSGNVFAGGHNSYGQSNVPAGLTGVGAIAAGYFHHLARKYDGTLVTWGRNDASEMSLPAGVTPAVAIAAGLKHSLVQRVAAAPAISSPPRDLAVTSGQPATLSVVASGVALTYQWQRDGGSIPGATHASLTFPSVRLADAGAYAVRVSSGATQTTSPLARLAVAPTSYPAAMGIDPAFAPIIELSGGIVNSVVVQPDGKIIVAGSFTAINGVARRNLARLNADGIVDGTFNPGAGPNEPVNVVALQADGKILIGGEFTQYNRTSRGRLARVNADGTLDVSFDPGTGANLACSRLALQSDGKVVVVGRFSTFNGTPRKQVARVNSDGSIDGTFNPGSGPNATVHAVLVQPDGRIVLGGDFSSYNGVSRPQLVRLQSNGALDTTFFPSGAAHDVYTMIALPDGKLLTGGESYMSTRVITRLNPDGSTDWSFSPGTGPDDDVHALVRQSDGKVLVGGAFTSYNGVARSSIARLNADGSLDPSFLPPFAADIELRTLALQSDGKLVAAGRDSPTTGPPRAVFVRHHLGGAHDALPAEFRSAGTVYALEPQRDGRFVIGGTFTHVNGVNRNGIARLSADGALDSTFDPGTGANAGGSVRSVALQSDGKVIAGGYFSAMGGLARSNLARLGPDGAVDVTFDPGSGPDAEVLTLALLPSGKAIVGGNFSTFAGVNRGYLARVNADGSLDPSFTPGPGPDRMVVSVVRQPDDYLVVGGWFTYYNGPRRGGLVRLRENGMEADGFFLGTGSDGAWGINALAVEPTGRMIVGGYFSSFSGAARDGFARVNSDASVDPAYATTAVPEIDVAGALLLQADGKVIVGEGFNSADTIGLARLGLTGASDATFSVTGLRHAKLSRIVMLDDGSLIVAGRRFHDGATDQAGIARLTRVAGPMIVIQPGNRTLAAGGNARFSVAVTAVPAPTYQWLKDGVVIAGANQATLDLPAVQPSANGFYSVVITNASGGVTSTAARLAVIPMGVAATQALSSGDYVAGGEVTVTNSLTHGGGAPGLTWQVLLPTGWSLASSAGDSGGTKPAPGTTALLAWNWTAVASTPLTFSYTLNVPPGEQAHRELAALVTLRAGGAPVEFLALPDPLALRPFGHTADTDRDFQLSLFELTRVIELYNTRHGTVRTGAYRVDAANLEDGFGADSPRAAGATAVLTRYHSSDTRGATTGLPRDGALDLFELTRVIELYNTRAGTVRTGRYHVQSDTEDGFAAGP